MVSETQSKKCLAMPQIIESSSTSFSAAPHLTTCWLARADGVLSAEGVELDRIAAVVGTPFYFYSAAALRQRYSELAAAMAPFGVSICFAVKANSNLSVLAEFAGLGCGMDIVSGGEMVQAILARTPPPRIIFYGVGKTRAEIRRALEAGRHQINIESAAELQVVAEIARALGLSAPIALRVDPDVDADTHAMISTALKGSKFRIPIDVAPVLYAKASTMPELQVMGLAVHIGSQIQDLAPFRNAWSIIADLVLRLRAAGLTVERLDLGGGLCIGAGASDGPDLADYAHTIATTVGRLDCSLKIEPGRWLVARAGVAGVLVTEVLYLKETSAAQFAIVDAAMNGLMRPALYDAHHPLLSVHPPRTEPAPVYRIVGPVCESSDDFGS